MASTPPVLSYSFQGMLTFRERKPYANAIVKLFLAREKISEAKSDHLGNYSLKIPSDKIYESYILEVYLSVLEKSVCQCNVQLVLNTEVTCLKNINIEEAPPIQEPLYFYFLCEEANFERDSSPDRHSKR